MLIVDLQKIIFEYSYYSKNIEYRNAVVLFKNIEYDSYIGMCKYMQNEYLKTCLLYACKKNKLQIVKSMLEKDNCRINDFEIDNYLKQSIKNNIKNDDFDYDVVMYLIEKYINRKNYHNYELIYYIYKYDAIVLLKKIIKLKIFSDKKRLNYIMLYLVKCYDCNYNKLYYMDMLRIMVDAGADDFKNGLRLACRSYEAFDVVEFFISLGATNITDALNDIDNRDEYREMVTYVIDNLLITNPKILISNKSND